MTIETQLSIKQVRAFVAVYRLGQLSLAAEKLSVSQSAVSVLIRQIESTLGMRLFDRSTRSLVATQAAHEAIGPAERVLQGVAELGESFRELGQRRRGRVQLAVTPAIGMALMPTAVRRFIATYPDIRLVLDDCAPNQFLPKILNGEVEFGIGTPEQDNPEIESRPLIRDHLSLVCADDHPLASRRQVRWAELSNVPLILVRRGYGVRRMIDAVAAKADVDLRIVSEVGFLASALWMAASGLGVTIFPTELVKRSNFDNLVIRPLIAPKVSRNVSLVLKRGRSLSPACESFIEVLRQDLAIHQH
jgi:DNA-binding transcriptional LysR family regulator